MFTILQSFHPQSQVFRLSPLVAALALLIAPVHGQTLAPVNTISASDRTTLSQSTPKPLNNFNYRFHQDHVLGTSLDVVINTPHATDAKLAMQAIEQEISRLDQLLSVWREDSEISTLNRNHQIQASPELFEVIAACEHWRSQTCGAFDIRLGQLISLWEQSNQVQRPDEATVAALLQQLDSILLDPSTRTIRTSAPVQIAPDGYAKGYIIDRALSAAQQAVPGIQGILIDIGGDLRVWGQSPQQGGWQIGVRDPLVRADNALPSQILQLNNQAIAFSGQGARELAGQSHLLNPNTGLPLNHVEQCVVVGQCAADADALATALAALPPEQGMQLIEQLLGYEAQLTSQNGEIYQTSGWHNLVNIAQTPQMLNTASKASSSSWPAGYQAKLDLVIPKIQAENYRAPYVSIWVTDSQKKLVRTLAAWGKDPKWLDSNYVWWRRYGRQMDNLDAVAKPSRQPGQYNVVWDGKDEQGKLVNAGKYLVHIETSREHGGHSYQTFELNVAPQGSSQTLPAQAEIGALKLNFQRGI
ncbi:DUF2271 domain-containing protein [Alkanindiges sp. WGS2144]|uniref:DUF2271 domain-containing protein n=1 Tax=Alkanindiges sp. WGS2144 TaxID=3366808 RepID=UPI0037532E80